MRCLVRKLARQAAALAIAATFAAPEALAVEKASKPLDAMSPAELDAFVQQINESANWRKYRRPGDPPDFVPGKPVRVMNGAGASFGRGRGGGARSFRKSGLASRRGGIGSRRRGDRDDQVGIDRGSRSSRSSSFGGSSRSRASSFGSSSGRSSSFGRSGGFGSDGSDFEQ